MNNKEKKYILIAIYIFAFIFVFFGVAFAYFTAADKSKEDALNVKSGNLKLGLEVKQKYAGNNLVPTDDEDIMKAYNNKCADDYGQNACAAYDLIITNESAAQDITGNIDFFVDHLENLSYLVLDEHNDIYQDITKVETSTANMPLGRNFILDGAIESGIPTSKRFTLVVWLTNLDRDQSEDVDGSYSASVEYSSIYGQKLSSSISGQENNNG